MLRCSISSSLLWHQMTSTSKYTTEKAMYLVDETGLAQYNTLKEKASIPISWVRVQFQHLL